jgi:flavorubredoxin
MTDVLDAAAVVVGSPTFNNQMFPTVADVLVLHERAKAGEAKSVVPSVPMAGVASR